MAPPIPDPSTLSTPENCVADFCLIPVRIPSNDSPSNPPPVVLLPTPLPFSPCPSFHPPSSPPRPLNPRQPSLTPPTPDRHTHPLRLRPHRRRPAPPPKKRTKLLDALCRDDGRYVPQPPPPQLGQKADIPTPEGSWDEVMRIIGQAHGLLHGQGVARIQTDIRVGSRTDKRQEFGEKVKVVEELLARDRAG